MLKIHDIIFKKNKYILSNIINDKIKPKDKIKIKSKDKEVKSKDKEVKR
jgi:hypothetical protein